MTYQPYTEKSCCPKYDAQQNLMGRTHYVDDDTLRWHKSRILETYYTDGGLLFALIESVAMDMHNTQRGFRYVIFDICGNVISRAKLEDAHKTKKQAIGAMWTDLNEIDAEAVTLAAIDRQTKTHEWQMEGIRQSLNAAKAEGKI